MKRHNAPALFGLARSKGTRELCDRDDVQRAVELAVATPIEPATVMSAWTGTQVRGVSLVAAWGLAVAP